MFDGIAGGINATFMPVGVTIDVTLNRVVSCKTPTACIFTVSLL
ncbi:hypothetical protein [Yoonia sp.]